jgi:hemoglobin-like flavoprotein
MNEQQIKQVQASYELVRARSKQFSSLFYQRLFELDPALMDLFKGDLDSQQTKLLHTVEAVVSTLDQLEPAIPTIHELGRRHLGYGVKPEHYSIAGAAWMWALDRVLGDDCTMEVKLAWTAAFCALAGIMLDGTKQPAQPVLQP